LSGGLASRLWLVTTRLAPMPVEGTVDGKAFDQRRNADPRPVAATIRTGNSAPDDQAAIRARARCWLVSRVEDRQESHDGNRFIIDGNDRFISGQLQQRQRKSAIPYNREWSMYERRDFPLREEGLGA